MAESQDLPEAEGLDPSVNQVSSRIIEVPDPSDEVVAEINRRFALATLKAEDIFAYRSVISTDAADSYGTVMDPDSTIPNYAADFGEGRSLLDSHNQWSAGAVIGQSFRGVVESIKGKAEGAKATVRVVVDWYMTRDEGTAIPIQRIAAGTIRRHSVGFGGEDLEIISMQDGKKLWESDYYPLQKLPDGSRATFLVKNGRGMEGSIVFMNSTPGSLTERGVPLGGARVGAVIARWADLAKRGEIPAVEVRAMGAVWGVRFALPPSRTVVDLQPQGRGVVKREGAAMPASIADQVYVRKGAKLSKATRDKIEELAGKSGEVRDGLVELIEAVVDDVKEEEETTKAAAVTDQRTAVLAALLETGVLTDRTVQDLPAAIRLAGEELAKLRGLAEDGKTFRATVIDEALSEGVAAYGAEKFDQTKRRAALEVLPLAEILERKAAWTEIADKRFPDGRRTKDAAPETITEEHPGKRVAPVVPISSYRVAR